MGQTMAEYQEEQKRIKEEFEKAWAKANKEDFILTPITAARLFDRIELMERMRAIDKDENWDWVSNRNLQSLPGWWEQETHDRLLVEGVLKHGAGKWEEIWADLREEEEPIREEGDKDGNEKFQEDKIPTIFPKRLKQIIKSYNNFKASSDERVLVGTLTTRDVIKEDEINRRDRARGRKRKRKRKEREEEEEEEEEEEDPVGAAMALIQAEEI